MRNLLNPKWLFIINTLPIVVLFFLCIGQFNIINTLLDEHNIQLWKLFGSALGMLGILNFIYAGYLTFKNKCVSILYGIFSLLLYILFIYLYAFYSEEIVPLSIPQWMISGNVLLYVGTFLMPTLAYSLFVLVSHLTSKTKEHKPWINFAIAIGIPIVGYLFAQIILPLWQPVKNQFFIHTVVILVIVSTLVFLFFLLRGVFILATKETIVWMKYQLAWKIPIAIVLPLLGLLVNNGVLFSDKFWGSNAGNAGIFGDFNSILFYILAIINGILLCLPNLDNKIYRLLLFFGRSITFTYTVYFFLVFLPFLPLSIIAIIAFGGGFLMLTPLLLFVIHSNELAKDVAFLKTLFQRRLIIFGILFLGFIIIPAFITINYLKDKTTLNRTLSYLYTPDYSKQYKINEASLQKTLNVVKHHKDRGFSYRTPYLSSYFNWLVLENLTLSDAKINTIENVFFCNDSFRLWSENLRNKNVEITNIITNSVYDKAQNAWKSWVDLEITNKGEDSFFAEYATTFTLPEGCWISDYYLFVGEKKESGILVEKKSAMWVFSQIRNINQDPGILYYLTGNKLVFRVFPFSKDEIRKTGIEFLHKEPVKFMIDNNIIELGNQEETIDEIIETESVIYVSAKQKQSLKQVQRKPYFHFLVNISKGQDSHSSDFIKRIEKVLENNKPLAPNTQISFVNSYVNTIPLNDNWKQKYQNQTFDGGFYLDRAIRVALFNAYKNKSYPIVVIVTDSIQNAVLDNNFSDFRFAFPESNLFFNLDGNGILRAHSLTDNPMQQLVSDDVTYIFDQTVLQYQLSDNTTAYISNSNEPSIILKEDIFEISETAIKEKDWCSALAIWGQWRSQILHPETSDKKWRNLVKYSFISKIMMPQTSYLVVENEAQRAILRKKQKQVLSGNKSLDLGEDVLGMSEPSLILLTVLLGIIFLFREKRKRKWMT